LDNVFLERLRRSVKHDDIYIKDYERVCEVETGLTAYFRFDENWWAMPICFGDLCHGQ
jgi:hypothetical protein